MLSRHSDGSAGDANYGLIGAGYSSYRQPEPRIAEQIDKALGDARSVLNVGAGQVLTNLSIDELLPWSHQNRCGRNARRTCLLL